MAHNAVKNKAAVLGAQGDKRFLFRRKKLQIHAVRRLFGGIQEFERQHAGRLRLKESDRIASVCAALNALGGSAAPDGDRIIITGTGRLRGGVVDACGDHRIAMLGAAASALCEDPVTIVGAEAVNKSYPGFFKDFALLGGKVRVE